MAFDPNKSYNELPLLPPKKEIETKNILKQTISAARSNVPGVTKKDRPLSKLHFEEFEKCFGENPNGTSKRKDLGEEGRFRKFTLKYIQERNYKLDISWLRDETLEDADDLPEPQVLASEAITELEADGLKDVLDELELNGK